MRSSFNKFCYVHALASSQQNATNCALTEEREMIGILSNIYLLRQHHEFIRILSRTLPKPLNSIYYLFLITLSFNFFNAFFANLVPVKSCSGFSTVQKSWPIPYDEGALINMQPRDLLWNMHGAIPTIITIVRGSFGSYISMFTMF